MRAWLTSRRSASGRARGTPSRTSPARAVRATIALLLLIPNLTGCYHYVPLWSGEAPSGAEVSVGITDAGRVGLAERVGPGIRRIDGQVMATNDSSLVLAVKRVNYIDQSNPVPWAGERVMLARQYVSDLRERRLSHTRSWIMAGLVTVAAVLSTKLAIAGFGGESGGDKPGGEPGQQQ